MCVGIFHPHFGVPVTEGFQIAVLRFRARGGRMWRLAREHNISPCLLSATVRATSIWWRMSGTCARFSPTWTRRSRCVPRVARDRCWCRSVSGCGPWHLQQAQLAWQSSTSTAQVRHTTVSIGALEPVGLPADNRVIVMTILRRGRTVRPHSARRMCGTPCDVSTKTIWPHDQQGRT